MEITFNISDKYLERHIWVHAGIELIAYKLYGEDVIHVKTVDCAQCGNCCRNLPKWAPDTCDGVCIYLGSEGVDNECGKGMTAPWNCLTGLQQKGRTEGCSVEYEIKKIE